jgi:hypothetical protein
MDGDCQTASEEWAKELAEAGISGVLAVGHFDNIPHYWLEIGGGLFDPTGGQFEELEGISPSEGSYSVTQRSPFGKPAKRKNGVAGAHGSRGASMKDQRITRAEAQKKMAGERGRFVCLAQDGDLYTAFLFPDEGVARLRRRRDGKIQSFYFYPPRSWERRDFRDDVSPFSDGDMRSNPRIGSMMEGFADLLKTTPDRDPPRMFIDDGKVRIDLTYGKRDDEGDLELDILRMKVGRSFVAAAAGELGSRVFAEHNTFTAPRHRGKGYMHLLYTTLLKDGIGIVSDKWNHSVPMRRVWMRLARDGWPVYAYSDEGEDVGGETMTRVPSDVEQDDPILDEVLVVAPDKNAFGRVFDEYDLNDGVGEHLRGGADSVYEGDEEEDEDE